MGWGPATGLRVIGVATKKIVSCRHEGLFSAPLSRCRCSSVPGPLPFLPEILICCHRYKNVVPQYSIFHYIIGGTAQKARRLSVGRAEEAQNEHENQPRQKIPRTFFNGPALRPGGTQFILVSDSVAPLSQFYKISRTRVTRTEISFFFLRNRITGITLMRNPPISANRLFTEIKILRYSGHHPSHASV